MSSLRRDVLMQSVLLRGYMCGNKVEHLSLLSKTSNKYLSNKMWSCVAK